jgi:hypothetical protein
MSSGTVRGLAVLVLLSGAVGVSSAGTIRSDRSDSLYLNLGAQPAYADVGQIQFSTSAGNYLGSGTLIAPNWVLTAGHVVDSANTMKYTVGGKSYTGSRWFAYPSWTGNLASGYDIGLLQLSSSVSGIAPATRYTGTAEIGKTGTYTGYGMTGTGNTGANKYDGKKRAGQNVLDRFYSGNSTTGLILLSDFDNPRNTRDNWYGSATPLNLEYLIAPGDSGGGVFVDFGAGPQLVGVNSFVMSRDGKPNSDYGDASGAARVSPYNGWIDSVLSGALQRAGIYETGNLTGMVGGTLSAVPEPASLSLLVLGTVALLRRRRQA